MIEKVLQWMYAIRNKKIIYRRGISFGLLLLLVTGVAMAIYVCEYFLTFNEKYLMTFKFSRIWIIIACICGIVILVNKGVKYSECSRILLSYSYLRKENKKNRLSWWRKCGIVFLGAVLVELVSKEVDNIAIRMEANQIETLVVGFAVLAIVVYIPLVESAVNKVKYYKMQFLASIWLFIIMIVFFAMSMDGTVDLGNDRVAEAAIFSIGQIAFAVAAVTNYKNMYVELEKENINKLTEYLLRVDIEYAKKNRVINDEIIMTKQSIRNFGDFWGELARKDKRKILGCIFVTFVIYILLAVVAIRINANI